MASNTYNLSKIVAENGDEYVIKAKGLEDQIQLSLTGDVSGQVTTDLTGDASISTTIGNGKVGTSKLADGAVTTGKIADKNVTLDKIADAARGGAVQDNDGVLATHAAVKSYVDAMVAGEGKYRGVQTVATINTWTAANLNNGDRVITSDSGTITLGNFAVVANQEIIFWKDTETQVWQTSEGNYKLKQTAVTKSGSALKTATGFTQNANGEIDVTFSDIQSASTSQKGVVQLSDATNSTSTTLAATANAVKKAYDLANAAKPKQTAKSSPTASGTDISFIDTLSQDANGVITATKKTVRSASASQSGVMSASDYSKLAALPTNAALETSLDGKADKVASATEGDVATLDADGNLVDSGKTLGTSVPANAEFTDTKVTAVGNHYSPSADSGAALTANASGATAAWGIDVVKGVTISRDAKGHVTGVSVTSGKIPANPDTDTKVTQNSNTENKEFPLLAKYTNNTTNETNTAKYAAGVTVNPSTKKITATGFVGDLDGNASTASAAKSGSSLESELASKASRVSGGVSGNFAALDANGDIADSGHKHSDYKTKQTAKTSPSVPSTGTTDALSFIDTVSQDTNGEITATKKNVRAMGAASSSAAGSAGLVPAPAAGKQNSYLRGDGTWAVPTDTTYTFDGTYNASTNKAATVSSVTSRIQALDATVTSSDGTNVQVKVTETDGKITAVNVTKDDTEKAFTIKYRASDNALVFSKAFGTVTE